MLGALDKKSAPWGAFFNVWRRGHPLSAIIYLFQSTPNQTVTYFLFIQLGYSTVSYCTDLVGVVSLFLMGTLMVLRNRR